MSDDDDKAERGMRVINRLFPDAPKGMKLPLVFQHHTIEHLFGTVWNGPELTIEQRSIITCAILVAMGRESEQRTHFVGAKNLGISRVEIEGLITHTAHYAGWPVAISAFRVLNEVWPET